MKVLIIGQLDWPVDGLNSGGSLVANKPGNIRGEILQIQSEYFRLYPKDSQGLLLLRKDKHISGFDRRWSDAR